MEHFELTSILKLAMRDMIQLNFCTSLDDRNYFAEGNGKYPYHDLQVYRLAVSITVVVQIKKSFYLYNSVYHSNRTTINSVHIFLLGKINRSSNIINLLTVYTCYTLSPTTVYLNIIQVLCSLCTIFYLCDTQLPFNNGWFRNRYCEFMTRNKHR